MGAKRGAVARRGSDVRWRPCAAPPARPDAATPHRPSPQVSAGNRVTIAGAWQGAFGKGGPGWVGALAEAPNGPPDPRAYPPPPPPDSFPGFGSFERKMRSARTGRNPRTGEPLEIAAKAYPAFSAGKGFKDAVGGGSAE